MELIRISERKLKIMLTPSDMCHFELDADSFGEDSQRMNHAFRLLLREIRKQTDFEADDRQIAVQYFPSRKGGCEMFISYTPENEKSSLPSRASSQREKKSLLPSPASSQCEKKSLLPSSASSQCEKKFLLPSSASRGGSFHRDCAYRFDRLEHLLPACRRLSNAGYIGESLAFCDDRGIYYLLISFLSSSPFSIPEEWSFLSEYGAHENAAWLRLYIPEHGKIICPSDAVNTLSDLA